MAITQLPMPPHYDAENSSRWGYHPDQMRIFQEARVWADRHNLRPSGLDGFRLHLLLVDLQKDFCFPEGSLYVAGRSGTGAIDDNRRVAEFIYRNLAAITNITTTMDTHLAFQIFFPSFWVDTEGRPLTPYRTITTEDLRRGGVRPNPAVALWLSRGDQGWLDTQVRFYCEELERTGKYELYLWPPHCLLGSDGHALAGLIHEARLFHSFARQAQSFVEVKGSNELTENYSVFRPEVLSTFEGDPLDHKNTRFLETLWKADAVAIAGQAASHCVKSTIEDLLTEILAEDPDLVRKVYLIEDCMSSVVVRDSAGKIVEDYTPEAEEALRRFEEAGMHVVRSTEPIDGWPEIGL